METVYFIIQVKKTEFDSGVFILLGWGPGQEH